VRNDLKVLRAQRSWTQARLAEELGVSRQTVNALEAGRYDPSLPLAFAIARVFGPTIEGILFIDQIASIRKQLIKGKLTNLQKGKVSAHYRVVTAPQKKK